MKHLIIPDTQVKPDTSYDHLTWAGKYASDTKPDVIIHLGDHWDMSSLSSYDVGKKSFEGRRYTKDIQAGNDAMAAFMWPILEERWRLIRNKKKQWNPRMVFLMGNHENRINRATENDPKLDGLISYDDFDLKGWEVNQFLDPVVIDGVAYCHYFTSGVMGRPVASAKMLLTKKHMSCVMGHVQDRDIAYARRADGLNMTGLFAGIYYQHDEEYLTPQTNGSWRGLWVMNDVKDGSFDEMPVSMNYLRKRYVNDTRRIERTLKAVG